MTYCKPALARGINSVNSPRCAQAVAKARQEHRLLALLNRA